MSAEDLIKQVSFKLLKGSIQGSIIYRSHKLPSTHTFYESVIKDTNKYQFFFIG